MENHLSTETEIRNEILQKTKEFIPIRIASIATRCADEAMFFRVLNELISHGLVSMDANFIFRPKN